VTFLRCQHDTFHTLTLTLIDTLIYMYFCSHILGMQATVYMYIHMYIYIYICGLMWHFFYLCHIWWHLHCQCAPYAAILLLVFHLTEANFGITTHFFTFASLASKQIIIVVIIEPTSQSPSPSPSSSSLPLFYAKIEFAQPNRFPFPFPPS